MLVFIQNYQLITDIASSPDNVGERQRIIGRYSHAHRWRGISINTNKKLVKLVKLVKRKTPINDKK